MAVGDGVEDSKLADVIRAIIDQPAAKQSEASLSPLLDAISSRHPPTRANAFTALALFLREQAQPGASLSAPLEALLQSTRTDDLCRGLAALSAVFQLSPPDGLAIIQADGFLARLADSAIDLLALGPSKSSAADLTHALAEFLALVMNQKPARDILRSDWPGCVDWLTRIALASSSAVSVPARCAGCLALVKLRLTTEAPEGTAKLPSFTQLTRIMLTAFLANPGLVTTAVEGLALVSQRPSARQILMDEAEALLRSFKALQSSKDPVEVDRAMMTDSSIAYGIATVLLHLSSFKVLKTDEDEAADRLRKLAVRGGQTQTSEKIAEVEEDDDLVIEDERVFGWMQDGLRRNNDLMDTVGWLVKSESKQVRRTTGKVLLNLVERQECRGKVLQAGGGRMMMKIIAALTVSTSMSEAACGPPSSDRTGSTSGAVLDPSDLATIQALAKVLITTNPLLIFGPSPDSPVLLSTIKPLTALFVHPSASLLQTFEALMALTNLTSLGGRIAAQVAETPRVLARLEECMVGVRTGENELVRRAATELVCNLSTTPAVLESFAPPQAGQSGDSKVPGAVSTRLHLLIALSSSEDLETALAASGALAILSEQSAAICQALLSPKLAESLRRVAGDVLAEGKIGVQHRLVSMLGNMMSQVKHNQAIEHLFDKNLVDSLKELVNYRLGDEDEESRQVQKLGRNLLENIEKHVKILEI